MYNNLFKKFLSNKQPQPISCNHTATELINSEIICIDCCKVLPSPAITHYSDTHYFTQSHNHRGIFKDIKKHNIIIPQIIQDTANDIFEDIYHQKSSRGIFRKSLILASIIYAYHKHDMEVFPDYLIEKFNLSKKQASKGLNYISDRIDRRSLIENDISPKVYIEQICRDFNISDKHCNRIIIKLTKLQDDENEYIERFQPQSIASALVYLYFKDNAKFQKLFIEKSNHSKITIIKTSKLLDI